MKIITNMVFLLMAFAVFGCHDRTDPRIHIGQGVESDSLANNIVTRPISDIFSALIGEGVDVRQATLRRDKAGLMELQVEVFNRAHSTKRFQYKVEWFDETGSLLNSKADVWLPASVIERSSYTIKAVAPRTEAVNFRMNTRKWE